MSRNGHKPGQKLAASPSVIDAAERSMYSCLTGLQERPIRSMTSSLVRSRRRGNDERADQLLEKDLHRMVQPTDSACAQGTTYYSVVSWPCTRDMASSRRAENRGVSSCKVTKRVTTAAHGAVEASGCRSGQALGLRADQHEGPRNVEATSKLGLRGMLVWGFGELE